MMTTTRRRSLLVAAAGVIVLLVILAGTALSASGSKSVDLKVALRGPSRCGAFSDGLPTLINATAVGPGARTPVVVVCLRNTGRSPGQLTMNVIDLLTADTACSAGESQVDATCGNNQAGELQDRLVQEYAILKRCRDTPTVFQAQAFAPLVTAPLSVGTLTGGATRCVALRIGYPAASTAAQTAAQTDSARWRYAFDLRG
jgi:hypothetical protein